jgi:hypothetical protein
VLIREGDFIYNNKTSSQVGPSAVQPGRTVIYSAIILSASIRRTNYCRLILTLALGLDCRLYMNQEASR